VDLTGLVADDHSGSGHYFDEVNEAGGERPSVADTVCNNAQYGSYRQISRLSRLSGLCADRFV